MSRHLLVVGGNGFVGSAVCKAALAKSWTVSSLSPSGRPFQTPAGHRPAWTENVSWEAGSALEPNTFKSLLPPISDVVVAVGTLFENKNYKKLATAGSLNDAIAGLKGAVTSPNPLTPPEQSYESLNKNTALSVLKQFLSCDPVEKDVNRTFSFLSAEDFGRPFIPVGYIKTKREAEQQISELCAQSTSAPVREILVRPGLMYHAHLRPLASPMAALLDLSATVHGYVPQGVPSPSKLLRAMSTFGKEHPTSASEPIPPALESLAKTLEVHPIHVDMVARAICESIEYPHIKGVIDTQMIKDILAGKKNVLEGEPKESPSESTQNTPLN